MSKEKTQLHEEQYKINLRLRLDNIFKSLYTALYNEP